MDRNQGISDAVAPQEYGAIRKSAQQMAKRMERDFIDTGNWKLDAGSFREPRPDKSCESAELPPTYRRAQAKRCTIEPLNNCN
jgi:hypothetical protein